MNDARLAQALQKLANGGGTVWAPMITTRQALKTPALQQRVVTMGGMAARRVVPSSWLVKYEANEMPDAATPAWTEVVSGTVAHAAAGGVFSITADTGGEYLLYKLTEASLSNALGTVLEARVRVTSSTSTATRGAALSICDGTKQFAVWLRAAGLNIDGQPHLALDLTGWHVVRLTARGGGCSVAVDGVTRQTGGAVGNETDRNLQFGSYIATDATRTADASVSEWDWVRALGRA